VKTPNTLRSIAAAVVALPSALSAIDTDADGLDNSVETNTGVYVSPTNTGTKPNSPVNQGYHYHRNAETFMLVGDALGRGMIDLLNTASDYGGWAAGYPGANLANPAADLDGDGLRNDEERIWGLDPTKAASRNPYAVPLSAAGTFHYTRRARALTELNYTIWTSTNLVDWTEDTAATQTPGPPAANGVETVAVTLATSPAGGRLFVRVRAAG
jgi:hypothetical protein